MKNMYKMRSWNALDKDTVNAAAMKNMYGMRSRWKRKIDKNGMGSISSG